MPNVPEVVVPSLTEVIAQIEAAEAAAEASESAATEAKTEKEAAEAATLASEEQATAAAKSAEEAEEGGYPAGKEAAETITVIASEPEVGAEGETAFGEPGMVHSIKAVFTGDGEKTAWKVKHELGTVVTSTTFHSESSELPGTQTLVKESKRLSSNEIEVVLETAPAEGETFWLIVTG